MSGSTVLWIILWTLVALPVSWWLSKLIVKAIYGYTASDIPEEEPIPCATCKHLVEQHAGSAEHNVVTGWLKTPCMACQCPVYQPMWRRCPNAGCDITHREEGSGTGFHEVHDVKVVVPQEVWLEIDGRLAKAERALEFASVDLAKVQEEARRLRTLRVEEAQRRNRDLLKSMRETFEATSFLKRFWAEGEPPVDNEVQENPEIVTLYYQVEDYLRGRRLLPEEPRYYYGGIDRDDDMDEEDYYESRDPDDWNVDEQSVPLDPGFYQQPFPDLSKDEWERLVQTGEE